MHYAFIQEPLEQYRAITALLFLILPFSVLNYPINKQCKILETYRKKAFEKILGKGENNGIQHIFPLLTLSQQALVFTHLQYKSFENTVGKGAIARYEQFFFSQSVFYPFGELSAIFIQLKIVICKLSQFWRV